MTEEALRRVGLGSGLAILFGTGSYWLFRVPEEAGWFLALGAFLVGVCAQPLRPRPGDVGPLHGSPGFEVIPPETTPDRPLRD